MVMKMRIMRTMTKINAFNFMMHAELAAVRSSCIMDQVGAVIVKDGRIIGTGYNGTPRGMANCNEMGCARCNAKAAGQKVAGAETCACLHAELNCIVDALEAHSGEYVRGSKMYCTLKPCFQCYKMIKQVGLASVTYLHKEQKDYLYESFASPELAQMVLDEYNRYVQLLKWGIRRCRS